MTGGRARPGYPGKRALDLLLVVVAAPLWIPLLAVLALAVRIGMGGPVVFRQTRTGLDGRPFELLKFRSMVDARGADGRPLPDDQRLTRFGRRLRESSLDELPELWNVLRGDMSLVGPRPLLPRYLARYSAYHARRHAVRPGLTGLAQVSGRNALGWSAKFDLDVEYVERCSFALDCAVLWRTVAVVFARHGVGAPGSETAHEFLGYDDDPAPDGARAPSR